MADPSESLIGGRYSVITSLGKGGMGVVYKAYDPVLDRTVAIKKMASNIVDHDEFRQRFFVEARAVARLNHPNIVTIHELEEDEGGIYIVMEMLDGVSLSAVMKHGDVLTRDAQVTLLAKVCSGLDYAHQRGVIHRDIKPANLMITTTGGVKILDFGIARFASSEMTSLGGTMLGTPHYMSPEQIEGRPVDARADWFSYGAVAYELIARQKPFDAPSVPPLLMKITNTPHVPLIDIAPDTVPPLSAIVDRLLAKDRDQRPASGADVQCALNASGDTNREDLLAAIVKNVLGDAGDVTIIQPLSTRGTTAPLIAAKPSAPSVIPSGTGTTPVGMRPGVNAPLAPHDPTMGVPSTQTATVLTPGAPGQPIPPGTGTVPGVAGAIPTQRVPANTATAGLPQQPAGTGPITVAPVAGVPTGTVPNVAPLAPPALAATAPGAMAPQMPAGVVQPGPSDVPAPRSSLKGALLVLVAAVLILGVSGVGVIWWLATHTAAGQTMMSSLLGRKPEATTASSEPSSSTPTSTPTPPSTPSSSASTPSSASQVDTPSTSTPSATPTSGTPAAPGATTPDSGAPNPGAPSVSAPSVSGPPVGTPSASTPAAPSVSSTPTSTGAPLPAPLHEPDAPARPTSEPRATEPRAPSTPRNDGPRHTAPAEPLPPERGPAPPPPPAHDDTSHLARPDTRAALDQSTVDAFKSSRSSSTPSGYGNIDSPMMQASVVRIKDTLETYSQAIEHQDLDTLRSVREPLTASESAQAQSASPTVVHFSEVDVRTDGKTAAVRARRAITVGGASKGNGIVEIRLSRRPAGWIITDIR